MNNERRIKRIENVLLGTGVVREPDYRHATATDVEDEMIYVKDLDERIATTIWSRRATDDDDN